MIRHRSLPTALTLAALLAAGGRTAAQDHPNQVRGFRADQTYQSGDLDHINLWNGNLTIAIPIGQSYPVGGRLSYGLTLTYSGNVWDVEERCDAFGCYTQLLPNRDSNAGLGWVLKTGKLFGPSEGTNDSLSWVYHSPDGAEHTFVSALHPNEPPTAGFFYTRDGTYIRLKSGPRQLEFPDGTIHTFDTVGRITRMEDRFGNYLNFTNGADFYTMTDQHGRTHTVTFKPAVYYPLVIDQVILAAFGGATATYTFGYTEADVTRACNDSDPQTGPTERVPLLTSLTLPDGSTYSMPVSDYDTAGGTCSHHAGHIKGMTLPTQGRIEWEYQNYAFPTESGAKPALQRSSGVAKRRLKSASGASLGEWTYTAELRPLQSTPTNPKRERVTTVTVPFGHKTVHYFSAFISTTPFGTWDPDEYGLPFTREFNDQTSPPRFLSGEVFNGAGTKFRTSYVRYERDDPDGGQDSNRRLASSRVAFHDDGGTVADETSSGFDGHGHYRKRTISGSGFPGSSERKIEVNYNPERGTYGQGNYQPLPTSSPWVLERFDFTQETEGAPPLTQTLYRSFCFDANTGFLQGRRVHAAGGAGLQTNDLVEVLTQLGGNVNSEKYFGGDTQAVSADPTQGAICSMVALPRSPSGATLTPVYQYSHASTAGVRSLTTVNAGGTTLRLLDLSIDSSTGLPSASRDPAGIEEQFSYDTLGRLTRVTPVGDPAIVDPTDALTTYTYCSATSTPACASAKAEVVVARKTTVTGAEITALRYRFDELGRLISEEERMPPSGTYQARTITYNLMGWRLFVSEKGATGGTTFNYNDPFGRVTLIRPADGAVHDVTLSYLGARQVQRTVKVSLTAGAQETPATTTEVYDRFGRLYEVTEPNGIKTRYDYDAGNRLKKVCQNATGAGTATCGQTRLFTYDNRGLLLSEQHPEKGASGNGVVSYFSYDARGHALRRIDGPNDLTFSYDGAERLTLVRETGGLQRTLKSFGYGTGTAAPDYSKGKVKTAKRFNYIGSPFNATAEVRDTYVYGGRGGRLSQTDTQLFFSGLAEEAFRQGATWDNLGNLASQNYPDCVAGDCVSSDAQRPVAYTYSYGRLATVPGFTGTATTTAGATVSQITYHPNGVVHQVPHANGMLYTVGRDTWGMARPAFFQANRGSTIYWNTGPHTFDGAGNLEGTGEFSVSYDTLSRVLQMSTMLGNTQSYTFDAYGNIQSVTTNGSTVGTPTSTTNRLTFPASYDAAGNLISWQGNSYEYDAFNQLKRYVAGAEDWRYVYTADDERFWSYRVGGSGSLWALRGLDGQVLRRYDAHVTWGTYEDYVYRDGQLLAAAHTPVAPAPKTGMSHFHLDHLGTPRMITNQNGASIGFHRYYPFGQEEAALQEGEVMKFTSHERDLASLAGTADDLDYMHARHHSPLVGRFLSTDPANSTNPSRPQSWNRYAYAFGNPLRNIDPDGLEGIGVLIDVENRQYLASGAAPYWLDPGLQRVGLAGGAIMLGAGAAEIAGAGIGTGVLGGGFAVARTLGVGLVQGISISRAISGLNFVRHPGGSAAIQGVVSQLFKGSDRFWGGTAGAIIAQLRSGRLVGGADHIAKGLERLQQISRLLSQRNLSPQDRAILQGLAADLQTALQPVMQKLNIPLNEILKLINNGTLVLGPDYRSLVYANVCS